MQQIICRHHEFSVGHRTKTAPPFTQHKVRSALKSPEDGGVASDTCSTSSSHASDPGFVSCVSRRAVLASVLPIAISFTQAPRVSASEFDPGFYAQWSYVQPSDILPYLMENSKQGDAASVIAALDRFGEYYP
eukprot:692818-Pyramimonas_sp.AAC.2